MAKKKTSNNDDPGPAVSVAEPEDGGGEMLLVGGVRQATVKLVGTSPYSPSRAIQSKRGDREDHDEFDTRCFRERAHVDHKGNVCIPGNALYLALLDAASYRGEKFKGMKTFFSLFERGVSVLDHLCPIKKSVGVDDLDAKKVGLCGGGGSVPVESVPSVRLYLPSDGVKAYKAKGKSTRVWRTFPIVNDPWEITVRYILLDGRITEKVFENHLRDAGTFIGLGRFRPASSGTNGRFVVDSIEWREG